MHSASIILFHLFFKAHFLSSSRFPLLQHIPPEFVPNIIHEVDANMVLHDPNGHQWIVKLCSTSTGMEFQQGWGDLVHNKRLEMGDFLMFKYISRSNFRVWIFGRNGCEKNIAFGESEETLYDLQNLCPVNPTMRSCDQSVTNLDSEEEENSQGKKPKSSSSSRGRPSKNSGHCQKSLIGKKRNFDKFSEEINCGERDYNGIYYISGRRNVTEAERNKAVEAACSFTSDKPFCLILLKPSHVYHGFWLGMPKKYTDPLQLPKEKTEMTLVDDNGKEWPVRFIWNGYKNGLSKGWRQFSVANNLEEGDVCIFERLDNGNMDKIRVKVHIFRFINKTTPYKSMAAHKMSDSIALPTNCLKKMEVSTKFHVDLPSKALTPSGKYAKQEIEQGKEMNNCISLTGNQSKKVEFSKEDLVSKLSAKESRWEEGKDAIQEIKEVEEENISNLDNCSKQANSKWTVAISEREMGCRRSPRLAK